MYSKRAGLVLGFHGCDISVRNDVVYKKGILLNPSNNDYDWLGGGVYFWENNYVRALEFANFLKQMHIPVILTPHSGHIDPPLILVLKNVLV